MNRSTESSHLLRQSATNESDSLQQRQRENINLCPCRTCKLLCLPSKAAMLLLFWTAAVGTMYNLVLFLAVMFVDIHPLSPDISISANDCLPYAILAFVSMFYPLSGFIADVCCGRLKIIVISMSFILAFVSLVCLAATVIFVKKLTLQNFFQQTEGIILFILILISLATFTIGLVGYHANLFQLGLDQLFEAPSEYLSLFILYALWAFKLGSLPFNILVPSLLCSDPIRSTASKIFELLPFIIAIFLIVLLIIGWYKRHWFASDAVLENPYITVFKIIDFARKHKYPLQRSAFTYSDNYVPSRLDFAKERYGGAFTTEKLKM